MCSAQERRLIAHPLETRVKTRGGRVVARFVLENHRRNDRFLASGRRILNMRGYVLCLIPVWNLAPATFPTPSTFSEIIRRPQDQLYNSYNEEGACGPRYEKVITQWNCAEFSSMAFCCQSFGAEQKLTVGKLARHVAGPSDLSRGRVLDVRFSPTGQCFLIQQRAERIGGFRERIQRTGEGHLFIRH